MPRLPRKNSGVATSAEPIQATTVATPAPSNPEPTPTPTPSTGVVKRGFDGPSAITPISAPSAGERVPWLRFFSGRSKNAADIRKALPGIAEGQAFIVEPTPSGNAYHYVKAMWLHAAKEYHVEKSYNGIDGYKVERVSLTPPADRMSKLKREIVAVCLVQTDSGLIACVGVFDGPRAPAAQLMAAAIAENGGGDWRAIVGTITSTPRTSKGGYPYVEARADTRSVSADDARALLHWTNDPDEAAVAESVLTTWRQKCSELEKLAASNTGS